MLTSAYIYHGLCPTPQPQTIHWFQIKDPCSKTLDVLGSQCINACVKPNDPQIAFKNIKTFLNKHTQGEQHNLVLLSWKMMVKEKIKILTCQVRVFRPPQSQVYAE